MHATDWISSANRRSALAVTTLEQAITRTVAYSDIFDYPLTAAEIHRYLIERSASHDAVDVALAGLCLVSRDGFFALPGRGEIACTRRRRGPESARLWREALRYGRVIASLPFVRMVAVTGELAMDNVQPASDIDYFIVTTPGRLWLCRLLVIGVVRLAALRKVTVCPNYLLSEQALTIHERNLYAAHEIAQMAPIAGHEVYRKLRAANGWVVEFLPNADGPPRQFTVTPRLAPVRRLAEWALSGRVGQRIERWEMDRKIRRLSRIAGTVHEASFSPEWCKGHVSGHEGRILAAFDDRRRALEGEVE